MAKKKLTEDELFAIEEQIVKESIPYIYDNSSLKIRQA